MRCQRMAGGCVGTHTHTHTHTHTLCPFQASRAACKLQDQPVVSHACMCVYVCVCVVCVCVFSMQAVRDIHEPHRAWLRFVPGALATGTADITTTNDPSTTTESTFTSVSSYTAIKGLRPTYAVRQQAKRQSVYLYVVAGLLSALVVLVSAMVAACVQGPACLWHMQLPTVTAR